MPSDARVDELLPLKPRTFALLQILRDGPTHGYGLLRALEERTGGELSIDAGLLYRTIARLVDRGVLRPAPDAGAEEDARRKYYELTGFGARVVEADLARQQRLLGVLTERASEAER